MNDDPKHILLVEDDDDHACLVLRAVKDHHVTNSVHRVADGAAAMEYLQRRGAYVAGAIRPDLVLLDLNLPKLSGHEVLRAIKSSEELRVIPVVILTTSTAEADRHAAYGAHANGYVTKPVDFGQFSQMIHDLGMFWTTWNAPPVETDAAPPRDGARTS